MANMALTLALLGVGDSTPGMNQFGPEDCLSRDYVGIVETLAKQVFQRMQQKQQQQHVNTSSSHSSSAAERHSHNRRLLTPAAADGATASSNAAAAAEDEDVSSCSSPLHDTLGCMPFDYAGLAFALVLQGRYDVKDASTGQYLLPAFLRRACEKGIHVGVMMRHAQLTKEQLEHSGWLQFFVYQTLYCTDVEQPAAAAAIKRAVPFDFQLQLHLTWLDRILVSAQPQGSELLQLDVDAVLRRLHITDALINCSAGRSWDEQHCWFAGHLIKKKNLALEYDYLMPLGPGRPKVSGWLACKRRIFNKFGLHVATIHKCFWDMSNAEQKEIQITRLLSAFPGVVTPEDAAEEEEKPPSYSEDKHLRFLRHKRQRFETWPPEKIEI